ncbi:hypothetical protein [Bacillus velezensis]|uniref:hypothetical protein n=1 Tax=Bacillus velezensis TaxID=492670 RepID=UPI003CE77A2C
MAKFIFESIEELRDFMDKEVITTSEAFRLSDAADKTQRSWLSTPCQKGVFSSYDCHLFMKDTFVRQILQIVPLFCSIADNRLRVITMNFESKYLVRWGLPGWVFMLFITLLFVINNPSYITQVIQYKGFSLVGFTALAAGLGIILGHIIHQISLFFWFVLPEYRKRKWLVYFDREFKIDKRIIEEELGEGIKDIYSYRLGQLHARRGLLTSLMLAFLAQIIFCYLDPNLLNEKTITLGFINGVLIMIMVINYHYFDRNLEYFMDRVKELENNSDSTDNSQQSNNDNH